MTAAALTPSKEYIENGVTTVFAVPFRFRNPTHISASRVATNGDVEQLVYGADYSVTGGATDAGGSLTVAVPAVAGTVLRIKRVTPRAQDLDYITGGTFPAESHESALDKAMLIDQEQDAQIGDTAARAVLVPDGESILTLPVKASRSDRLQAFDGNGNPVAGPLAANVETAIAGVLPGLTFGPISSVVTIAAMQALLKATLVDGQTINVLGYYAIGDGGGGNFRWTVGDATAVDGGMVIASGEGGTGRWTRVLAPGAAVTSKMYGAKGDKIANDTARVQARLDRHAAEQAAQSDQAAAPNIFTFSGTVLDLPAGFYVCDNLTYNGASLRMRSDAGAAIKFNAGCGLTAINVGKLYVHGINFIGGATPLLVKNNNLDGGYFVVDNCQFHDQTDWPINFEPITPNSGYNTNHLSGLAVIRDCIWYNTNGCVRSYFDLTILQGCYPTLFRAAHGANCRWQANRAAFESRSLGDGMIGQSVFCTPIANNGSDGNVWYDNYPGFAGDQSAADTPQVGYSGDTAKVSYGGGIYVFGGRYGAEEGGVPIIRNWCHGLGKISETGNVHLVIQTPGLMAAGNGGPADKAGVVVLKKGMPNSIRIIGGSGPSGAPLINATAMLDEAGAPSSLGYWLDNVRDVQGRYSVDIEGFNSLPSGSLPPELGSCTVAEGSLDGLSRMKIFPNIGLRGKFTMFNNTNRIYFGSEAYGGAISFRSDGGSAADRSFQMGSNDNAGNPTMFWEVNADSGALQTVVSGASDLGAPSRRVATGYFVNAPDVSSDARGKKDIADVEDRILDAWAKCRVRQYRQKDTGDERLQFGYIAQEVVEAFADAGMDALEMAIVSHHTWEEREVEHPAMRDEDGNIVTDAWVETVAAGDRYSMNYTAAEMLNEALRQRERNRASA